MSGNILGHERDCDCAVCESEMMREAADMIAHQKACLLYSSAERETAMTCYQIASSHELGPDAAKTIRETFGLEI